MAFSTSDVLQMIDDWRSDDEEDIFEDPEFQLPREDESEEELTDEETANNENYIGIIYINVKNK